MDYGRLFFNDAVREEFLDRFDELAANASAMSGFEVLEGGLTVDRAADAVTRMNEGAWTSGEDPGLEAIVQRFTRPVHLVQGSTFMSTADGFPESAEITALLEKARVPLEAAIPSVGRIDLRNHQLEWAGTGWLVGPGLVATAGHVAREFAETSGGFAFVQIFGRTVHATLDMYREYLRPEESRFPVHEVVWIEPDRDIDVALLRIAETGEMGQSAPPPIELATDEELTGTGVGRWVGVIGYPAADSRAGRLADQQRIFDGVYNHKRLAVGRLTASMPQGLIDHDATTLGGNSGSPLIDLITGKAMALHIRGHRDMRNLAVAAAVVKRLIRKHAS